MDRQKIGGIAKLADQFEFVVELRAHLLGHAIGIAPGRAVAGQPFKFGLRRRAGGRLVVGIFVSQFVEAEGAARRDLDRARDRVRPVAEQPRHLGRRFQVAFGIGGQAIARRVDGAVGADAGDDVHQAAAVGRMGARVVGRDQWDAMRAGEAGKSCDAPRVVAAIEMLGCKIERAGKAGGEAAKMSGEGGVVPRAVGRQGDDDLAVAMVEQVGQRDIAFPLGRAPPSQRQQLRQPPIGGAVGGQAQNRRRVGEIEPRADHQPDARRLCFAMGAHHPGQRIAVGDRDRVMAERRRRPRHLLGMRGAMQEGEIGGDLKLGVGVGGGGGGHGALRVGQMLDQTTKSRLPSRRVKSFVIGDDGAVACFGAGDIETIVYRMLDFHRDGQGAINKIGRGVQMKGTPPQGRQHELHLRRGEFTVAPLFECGVRGFHEDPIRGVQLR